jgi:hypothetical protein
MEVVRHGAPMTPKFEAAVLAPTLLRVATTDLQHDLIFAVRREFPNWYMPDASPEDLLHSRLFWNQEYLPKGKRTVGLGR